MRKIDRLTSITVTRLKEPGYYLDGSGLYLQVGAGGSKSWVFQYTLSGRRREMGIGSLVDMTLSDARREAAKQRALVKAGDDPIAIRTRIRAEKRATTAVTFKHCAERCIADKRAEWSNPKHALQWESTLATYAFPFIGELSVEQINTGLVRQCLDPIWTTKTETATRVRQRIETVLDWAKVHGYRTGDNPAAWRGHLEGVLANPSKVAKAENHPALEYERLPAFMVELRKHEGVAADALRFTILAATRTGESIGATWTEIDFKAKTWTVPAERMKAKVEHVVPLADSAVALLKRLYDAKTGDYVFPGAVQDRPLSNMAMLQLVRGMGTKNAAGDAITVHGFRSTFRQWAAEQTTHPREVAEHALAHRLPDKVEAAYQRSTMVDKRRALMADWARFVARKPRAK
jgi:integrase